MIPFIQHARKQAKLMYGVGSRESLVFGGGKVMVPVFRGGGAEYIFFHFVNIQRLMIVSLFICTLYFNKKFT